MTTEPSPAPAPTTRQVVRAYIALPHAVPILVVLVATLGFALLVTGGAVGVGEVARLLLAMLGGQLAIGAVNEIVDADLDAATKPWKPIPSGAVPIAGAWAMTVSGLLLMTLFGVGFGPASLALLLLGTGLGLLYDLVFKRTPLAWLPYVLALPLLPIWVRTSLVGFDPRLLLLYPLGALAVVGIHLAQTLPDTATDRSAGLRNPGALLGQSRAMAAAWLLVLSAPLFAALLAAVAGLAADSRWIAVGAVVAGGAVAVNAVLATADRDRAVRWCFPLLATGTVVLGLCWVLAVG